MRSVRFPARSRTAEVLEGANEAMRQALPRLQLLRELRAPDRLLTGEGAEEELRRRLARSAFEDWLDARKGDEVWARMGTRR